MSELTIIVGLPGSGKSCLVRELSASTLGLCIEDYMKNSNNNSPRMTHSKHFETLVEKLRGGLDCVVADIVFCEEARRTEITSAVRAAVPDVKIKWIYFENDKNKCCENAKRRGRSILEEELRRINELSNQYQIPIIETRPVYSPEK